jgi:hypothetical protein
VSIVGPVYPVNAKMAGRAIAAEGSYHNMRQPAIDRRAPEVVTSTLGGKIAMATSAIADDYVGGCSPNHTMAILHACIPHRQKPPQSYGS